MFHGQVLVAQHLAQELLVGLGVDPHRAEQRPDVLYWLGWGYHLAQRLHVWCVSRILFASLDRRVEFHAHVAAEVLRCGHQALLVGVVEHERSQTLPRLAGGGSQQLCDGLDVDAAGLVDADRQRVDCRLRFLRERALHDLALSQDLRGRSRLGGVVEVLERAHQRHVRVFAQQPSHCRWLSAPRTHLAFGLARLRIDERHSAERVDGVAVLPGRADRVPVDRPIVANVRLVLRP